MKSHELARALELLAKALKTGPNIDMLDMRNILSSHAGPSLGDQELKISLYHLTALSKIDKQKWISLIKEMGFPVQLRARDGSRDIIGKLFNYLEKHDEARDKLKASAQKGKTNASPELMKALSSLLGD